MVRCHRAWRAVHGVRLLLVLSPDPARLRHARGDLQLPDSGIRRDLGLVAAGRDADADDARFRRADPGQRHLQPARVGAPGSSRADSDSQPTRSSG